jgi:hypothetical protein
MLPKVEALKDIGSLSAERCGQCHTALYTEWKGSLMAAAATNPFFEKEREEQSARFLCGRCHHPLENQEPRIVFGLESIDPLREKARDNPGYDDALSHEGVTCVVCHLSAESVFLPGTPPEIRHPTIYNARKLEDANAPHPLAVGPGLAESGRVCARCHEFDPLGSHLHRPPLDTMAEYAAYRENGGKETCTGCHMPAIERSATSNAPVRTGHDHRFAAVKDAAFIRRYVTISSIEAAGGRVALDVVNEAGHRVPTGEPSRVLEIRGRLLAGASTVAENVVQIRRSFDTVTLRDDVDGSLLPREKRRIAMTFPASAWARADAVSVSVDFLRYAPDHPLVHGMAGVGTLSVHVLDVQLQPQH